MIRGISRLIIYSNKSLFYSHPVIYNCISNYQSGNSEKYQNIWGEDLGTIYSQEMPRSKEYVSSDDSSSNDSVEKPAKKQKKEKTKDKEDKAESSNKAKATSKLDEEEPTWELGSNRQIKVREFRGKLYVDIREMYEKDGKLLPGKKGIAMSLPQFEALMKVIHEVEDVAHAKAKSK